MMQYGGGLGLTGVGGEMETSSQGRHLSHPPLNDKLSHRYLLKGSLLNQHWLLSIVKVGRHYTQLITLMAVLAKYRSPLQ